MKKATAPQMRRCLEMAEVFKRWGIRFVPMPATDEMEFERLCRQMTCQLETLAMELEIKEAVRG